VKWDLAIVAAALLAVAAVSRRLTGTSVTPAMAFVAIGLLVGHLVAGQLEFSPSSAVVRTLAEATLTVVLFLDASRIRLRALRREYAVPVRLLAIGLPLTIVLGALIARAILPGLPLAEAVVLAIVLAPTDAALGQAVVSEPRLPSRVRQGLNVESGLNDGICVPLLLLALAVADVESSQVTAHHAVKIVSEEIGYGIVGGVVGGLVAGAVATISARHDLISPAWRQVVPVAGAALAYGVAAALGGSGFIAAFVGGGVFGYLVGAGVDEASRLSEEIGGLLGGVTFLLFAAALLGVALEHLSWGAAVYAVLSLTVIRMLPVAISMIGSGASAPTVAFLSWFGPRGLASIVFAVLVVQEAHLPGTSTILVATYATIGLSVFAHGITAAPLARRYADWYEAQARETRPLMESVAAPAHRPRGAAARGGGSPTVET
jgi:NhaP-type Na+/H+ or K+/H+ antiporter